MNVLQNIPSIEEIASSLIGELSQAVSNFFDDFDVKSFEEIVEIVGSMTGTIIVSGVGKSGFVGKKIAATLNSSGTPALFLSPQDALHGDLGVVREGDMVLLLSKSGTTDELIALCPALKRKKTTIISIVCGQRHSQLSQLSDYTFVLPQVRELCPFDLAPTTSTICQSMFGDLLSMTLMRKKGITREAFILNHPAGRIGKRHLLQVGDIMLRGSDIPTVAPEMEIPQVLVELSKKKCGCVCIVDTKNTLLGIFTDGDLRRGLQSLSKDLFSRTVEQVMTKSPKVISPQELAYSAMQMMEENPSQLISVLPVLDASSSLVGILRMHDILQAGL